jgi:hypothetical protein
MELPKLVLPPGAPTALTLTALTPAGTANVCSSPVNENEQVTALPDCTQPDGNAADAEPASATAHNPNKPSVNTNNLKGALRPLACTDLTQRAPPKHILHPIHKYAGTRVVQPTTTPPHHARARARPADPNDKQQHSPGRGRVSLVL